MANKNLFLGSGPRDPHLRKSKYDFSYTNHLTASLGKIYPCFVAECPPGTSFRIRPTAEFDLMPMYFPLQSRITMHMSFYKCSFRNLWRGYKDWVSGVGGHVAPYVAQTYDWHNTGSLADYMGICSYSAAPTLGWENVLGIGYSQNPSEAAFGFCYTISQSRDIVEFLTKDGISYELLKRDSLGQLFSKQNSLSDSAAFGYVAALMQKCKFRIAENQPYLQFNIVQHAVPPKLNQLRVGFVAFQNSANPVYYLHMGLKPYRGVISLADSFAAVETDTYQLVKTRQSEVNPGQNVVVSTYLMHLNDHFVMAFNDCYNRGYEMRIFLAWEDNSENDSIYGSSLQLISKPGESPASTSIFAQDFSYSNGHYVGTSSNFQIQFRGIQRQITYRTESAILRNPLRSPFVIHDGEVAPKVPLSVLPFRMYEFIYNLYIRNVHVDPFRKNGVPVYNDYLTNDGDGADGTTPLDFKKALYEYDIFTTAKFTPMAGNAPLVGISHVPGAGQAVFHMRDQDNNEYTMTVTTTENGSLTGISEYPTDANESTIKNLDALIKYGISINDFRSVAAFTRFLERKQRTRFDYKGIVKEFYGTNAPIGEEFPEYLGGFDRPVNIYKLENQSAGELPLGMFAGTGRVGGKCRHDIKVHCSEQSYVMGLVWFSVTPVYPQSLPKHWTKRNPLDYFNPAFAMIGNQPIYNYEVAPLQAASDEELNGVFGYQRPWYEYTMRFDEVHGQFRDSQHNYLIQREFGTMPQLGKDFVEIEHDDLTNVFSYTEGTDKIFGAIRFDIADNSLVPKFIEPSIVG